MKSEKITHLSRKPNARRYLDSCATAHALDLIGDRWALLVVRELMLGPRRFGDLRASLPGISANVLSQRLDDLEDAGILTRHRLPPPAAVQVYELTPWGYESETVIQALGRWAARSPGLDPTLPFSAASLLLSLRTMFDGERAAGFEARIGIAAGDEQFLALIMNGKLEIAPGALGTAQATLEGEPEIIAAAIYDGQPLATLEEAGALRIDGDRALAERFITLFPLPAKAGPG